MSGLDKIISQIKEEADDSAAKILNEANEQAAKIKAEAEEDCLALRERATVQNEAAREDIMRRNRSTAQMQRRRELLVAKQEVIDEIIGEAHDSMLRMEVPEYFGALVKLVEKHAQPQDGKLCLNQKDLDRVPADFAESVSQAAQKKGGTLTVSDQPCQIDGGFLLIYGDIEENCSFETLFVSERENLQDKLHTFLFA